MIKVLDVLTKKDSETGLFIQNVSEKLQAAGLKVIAVTGGSIGDPGAHYFDISLVAVKKLVNKRKQPILNSEDLEAVEEVKKITPSKQKPSNLREVLKGKTADIPGPAEETPGDMEVPNAGTI